MMHYAQGIAEAIAAEAGFADPATAAAFWAEGGAEVVTEDLTYPGGAGQDQRLRLYRGGDAEALTLLYIHGGGWTGGSIELHDRSARGLAVGAACNVVSISYRLAPQHPFPAALMDCRAAAGWIRQDGAARGLNPGRLAIGGASAGANLACAAALSESGGLAGLLLFYAVLGCDFETPSYLRHADGPGLSRARMQALFRMYDPGDRAATEPLIAPLGAAPAALAALPPSAVIAAERDVLADENRDFARRLADAGVPVTYHEEPGVTHGFINRGRLVPAADFCVARAARFLSGLS